MTGNLGEKLTNLLKTALPDLFKDENQVKLNIISDLIEIDPESADSLASEPRPDDYADHFKFNSANPGGPYTLTKPPYQGPRLVRLTTDVGDRLLLKGSEVIWDEVDPRAFKLELQANRELGVITGVEVLYGVTAIFTKINARQTVSVQLESDDAAKLEMAEVLVTGVIELNRQYLVDAVKAAYSDGDYSANIEIKSLKLLKGTSADTNQRLLTYQAEMELKASRALREDEGKQITRIRTPGRPLDPARPIDIHIDVGV